MNELAHGLLLQDQGRLEEAESCFRQVLAREPENDFAHSRLALCQLGQSGKRRHALESVDAAIRIRPDDGFYHALRSLVLAELRKGKESLEAADRAVALAPEDGFVLATRANACCVLEHWTEAEEWSRRSLAVDGESAMAANLLAHALRMQGKSSENRAAVASLLAVDPESSLAHVNAGWSALQDGARDRAEDHFRESLRLDPESDMAREGLLESFRARSMFYRAYLAYGFFLQRFTGRRQWAILIGLFVLYQIARQFFVGVSEPVAIGLGLLWLGLVLWVWLAPGMGDFLILLDRSARLALRPSEKTRGIAVGGALLVGIPLAVAGVALGFLPVALLGIVLIASTLPASLFFGNSSRRGRIVFGSILGYLYFTGIILFAVELFRSDPPEELEPASLAFGAPAVLLTAATTWLGNLRSLRSDPED